MQQSKCIGTVNYSSILKIGRERVAMPSVPVPKEYSPYNLRLDGIPRNALILQLVGTGRFELPTPRTPSECSTRLSHVPTGEQIRPERAGRGFEVTISLSLKRRV